MNEAGYNITDIKTCLIKDDWQFFPIIQLGYISVTIQTDSATHKCWLRWMNQQLPTTTKATSQPTLVKSFAGIKMSVGLVTGFVALLLTPHSHRHSAILPQLLLHIFCYPPQKKTWSQVCIYIYIYIYTQGVAGGTDQTSGECSLGQTIQIEPKTPISKVERLQRYWPEKRVEFFGVCVLYSFLWRHSPLSLNCIPMLELM